MLQASRVVIGRPRAREPNSTMRSTLSPGAASDALAKAGDHRVLQRIAGR